MPDVDEGIVAEVARLRAERTALIAAQDAADRARARDDLKAEAARANAATIAEADRKAAELVHERTALAVEVEALRAKRADALAKDTMEKAADLKVEVINVAADVEQKRTARAEAMGQAVHTEAIDLATSAALNAAAEASHTAEQDKRLDLINGSQEETSRQLVLLKDQLTNIQKGIDEAAAVTKALSEKGVTSRQLQMGIAALMIPIFILIVSLLVQGG